MDVKILNLLNKNARMSFRKMAKELKISMSTVSNRIKNMENEAVINGYIPVLDPQKVGYGLLVMLGVRISRGKLLEVQNKISKYAGVFGVYDITGEWDSIVLVRFRDRGELNTFIKWTLNIEYVERTYTQVVLNVVKEEVRVAPLS